MALTGNFEASELLIFKLRTILDRIGTKILALFVQCSCEETVPEIVQLCSQLLLQPRKKRLLKLSGFPSICPYDEDLQKARQEIEKNSTKATLNKFDITFLNKFLASVPQDEAIKDDAKELRKIVKLRNDFSHGNAAAFEIEKLEKSYEELEKLLPAALEEVERIGKARFTSALTQHKRREIEEALEEIQAFKIGVIKEIKRLRFCKIDELFTSAAEYLTIMGHDEMLKSFRNHEHVNPVAFLLGKSFSFHLERFFTAPEFKLKTKDQIVHFEEVLDTIEYDSTCIVIEGPSGIGKTTFNRVLLAKKSSGERFQDLWFVPVECRSKRFDSLEEVIADLFPEAAKDFTSEKLCRAFIALHPLFLIDGLDEKNEKSGKVISEILSYASKGEARFLATSRPEAIEEFLSKMAEINFIPYEYFELTGIAREDLDSVVDKYCKLFSESKGCSFQVEKMLVDKAVRTFRNLFKLNSPLVLCLVTYLIVNKESDPQIWESRTSLYCAIFDAFYKKLKLRLRGKESYHFTERKFRSELTKFLDNLHSFSLASLRKNKLIFSCHEIATLEENLSSEFGEEAVSAIFVVKSCVTRTGIEESPTYSYPHKSFQEFLAAKQIFKKVTSAVAPGTLTTFLKRVLVGKEEPIFFLSGLLAADDRLTRNLCDEFFASLELREKLMYEANMALQLIQESKGHPVFVELTSNNIANSSISERDLKSLNLVLQRDCPSLFYVKLNIRTIDEEILETLRYLKDKAHEIDLCLHSEITDSTGILREIHGGRCTIVNFKGRLTIDGMKLLPKSLSSLYIYIVSEEEIEVLKWLADTSENGNQEAPERNIQFILTFEIFDTCDVTQLPGRFLLPSKRIEVTFSCTEINKCLEIAKWLCRVKFRPGTIIILNTKGASIDFDQTEQLVSFIKKMETAHMVNRPPLMGEGEMIRGFFTEKNVEEFASYIGTLIFKVCGSASAVGLNTLVERLKGGNDQQLRPIKILSLRLEIDETCDLELLPETLPSGSGHLTLWLEASRTRGSKFEWLLGALQKLPKREWCTVHIGTFSLNGDQLEVLLETLRKLGVKAEFHTDFRNPKLGSLFASLHDRYVENNLILR